jgi:hypothetical protein
MMHIAISDHFKLSEANKTDLSTPTTGAHAAEPDISDVRWEIFHIKFSRTENFPQYFS